jgi:hypothetical protein
VGRGVALNNNGVVDDLPNAFWISQNVIVPKSQDAIAAQLEPACTFAVSNDGAAVRVLATVNFNHEFRARTEEVDNVGTDRLLAPERNTFHLLTTQNAP